MITDQIIQSLTLGALDGLSGSKCCSYLRKSIRHQVASEESRQRLQQERWSKVCQAANRTQLYRDRINENSSTIEKLKTLKPVSKTEIRLHYPTGILSTSPTSDWRYLSTSGTTDRLSVVSDFQKRDYRRSCELHALIMTFGAAIGIETVEIPPNACNVVCGVKDHTPATFRDYFTQSFKQKNWLNQQGLINLRGLVERHYLLRKQTLAPIEPAIESDFLQSLGDRLTAIQRTSPRLLRAYPLYLVWLADLARQLNLHLPSIECILPYGGLASPSMIRRIENGFRSPFRNVYGTSELGILAASCGHQSGMHVFDDLFLAEVRPHSANDSRGLLLITDLTNTVMPFIGYQVGDIASLENSNCSCGRKSPRLTIHGRQQECFYAEQRIITASEIADSFFDDTAIANGRVDEVSAGCFEASIVAMPGSNSKPDLAAWEQRFRTLFTSKIRRLKSRVVPYIMPESSGKYLIARSLNNLTKTST